ncbi:hypothetical protein B5807_06318 [Epicoccum nigrum]|uniref:Acyl-CoA dehydrogenase/oxidase C-terminal domain-containing protein n=1 Tax=Epicoccum nigrum TaxID=105696 RepID=A0A1Y2LVI8_EPING|nr:hypothetical protein B5807_06318 [Epicoccum nigrum]
MAPTASSSTAGFFQALPSLPPQYTSPDDESTPRDDPEASSISDDKVLDRILDLYLPQNRRVVTSHLHRVARLALDARVLAHAVDAETNHPVLRQLTTFGQENRNDPLWTTAGWQRLKEMGQAEGVVAVAYSQADETAHINRRVYEFALGHLWGVAGAMTGCPMSMTDGAATLLARHLRDPDADQMGRARVFEEAYRRLTSRDPGYAWTSGQWMTERSGGSDVSGTETLAARLTADELARDQAAGRGEDAAGMPLGPWRINGFKWFSSATDSDMAVLLARTDKGLSAFYMPMRRRKGTRPAAAAALDSSPPETELNGVRIQRLKTKLGTRSLPTAELALHDARAWLIGTEGRGVAEISAVLNITRLSTAAGSVGNWARGLAVCRAYSQVRRVRGGLLSDNALHLRWMAAETVKYHAAAHFTFLGVALQGALEQSHRSVAAATLSSRLLPASRADTALLLRLLLPAIKAAVSVASVAGLRHCIECLGGVGYCENNEDGGLLNVAKLFRDNLVNPIWEGTVSVMAEDAVRVLADRRLGGGDIVGSVFAPWVRGVLGSVDALVFGEEVEGVRARLARLGTLVDGKPREELLYRGRDVLDALETIVCAAVLLYDASVHPSFVAHEVARRYVRAQGEAGGASSRHDALAWKDAVRIDKSIFLGSSSVGLQERLEKL